MCVYMYILARYINRDHFFFLPLFLFFLFRSSSRDETRTRDPRYWPRVNLFQPAPLYDPFSTIDLNYIFILFFLSTNGQSKTKQFAFTTLFTIQRTTLKVSKNNLP